MTPHLILNLSVQLGEGWDQLRFTAEMEGDTIPKDRRKWNMEARGWRTLQSPVSSSKLKPGSLELSVSTCGFLRGIWEWLQGCLLTSLPVKGASGAVCF